MLHTESCPSRLHPPHRQVLTAGPTLRKNGMRLSPAATPPLNTSTAFKSISKRRSKSATLYAATISSFAASKRLQKPLPVVSTCPRSSSPESTIDGKLTLWRPAHSPSECAIHALEHGQVVLLTIFDK